MVVRRKESWKSLFLPGTSGLTECGELASLRHTAECACALSSRTERGWSVIQIACCLFRVGGENGQL